MGPRRDTHVCGACGATTPRWLGRCPACAAWGTLGPVTAPEGARCRTGGGGPPPVVRAADLAEAAPAARRSTGFDELDRVLGGGLVPGAAVLLGGEPGVGKSTLLLQVAERVAGSGPVLYVTAEESLAQVGERARRLGATSPGLRLCAAADVGSVRAAAAAVRPVLLVVDSVQTVRDGALAAPAGSLAQVRQVTAEIVSLGRETGATTLLVGQVTKDGVLAGPKALEHLVDTVAYFEGDDRGMQRIVRCAKNRFGAVDEIGVFEMSARGLEESRDVSARLVGRRASGVAGSAVAAVREGRRTLLVEVQALTVSSTLAVPRRTVVGLEAGRAALVGAVLTRWCGVDLGGSELFVGVVGGVRVSDPAADLAVAAAIASAHVNRPVPADTVWAGEVGLCGDLREIPAVGARVDEAARLGFARCVVPRDRGGRPRTRGDGIAVVELTGVAGLLGILDGGGTALFP